MSQYCLLCGQASFNTILVYFQLGCKFLFYNWWLNVSMTIIYYVNKNVYSECHPFVNRHWWMKVLFWQEKGKLWKNRLKMKTSTLKGSEKQPELPMHHHQWVAFHHHLEILIGAEDWTGRRQMKDLIWGSRLIFGLFLFGLLIP